MNPKKQGSALGKGLDALIKSDYLDDETEKPDDIEGITPEHKESGTNKTDHGSDQHADDSDVNEKIVQDVLLEVHKNPRISLWSAKSAAVLRFLKKTKPEFSISHEASELIENAVKDKHPDIWKIFEDKGL